MAKLSYSPWNLNHCKKGHAVFYKEFFSSLTAPFFVKEQGRRWRRARRRTTGTRSRARCGLRGRNCWREHRGDKDPVTPAPTTTPRSEVLRRRQIAAGFRAPCLRGRVPEASSGLGALCSMDSIQVPSPGTSLTCPLLRTLPNGTDRGSLLSGVWRALK